MKKINPRLGFTLPALWLAVTAPAQNSTTIGDPSGVSGGRAVSGRLGPDRLGGNQDFSGGGLDFPAPSGAPTKLNFVSDPDGTWLPAFAGHNLVQNYFNATGPRQGILNPHGLLASWCDTYSIDETSSYGGGGPNLASYYKPMFDPASGVANDGGGLAPWADLDPIAGISDTDWADNPFMVGDHGSFRPVNDWLDSGNPWDSPVARPRVGANPAGVDLKAFANQRNFLNGNRSFAPPVIGVGANASAIAGIDGNSLAGIGTGGPAGEPQIDPVTPEPSILALVGMGATGLLLYRRRFGTPQ